MSNIETFMPGDKVFYSGEKFKNELTREGKPLAGWIHATVDNEDDVYVVEFPDAKDGDYIIPARLLSRARTVSVEKNAGPEIQPRRPKREDA